MNVDRSRNLPVITDEALNLVTRVSYPSRSRQIVRTVPDRGRYGRIGRPGCCHGCCHDLVGAAAPAQVQGLSPDARAQAPAELVTTQKFAAVAASAAALAGGGTAHEPVREPPGRAAAGAPARRAARRGGAGQEGARRRAGARATPGGAAGSCYHRAIPSARARAATAAAGRRGEATGPAAPAANSRLDVRDRARLARCSRSHVGRHSVRA